MCIRWMLIVWANLLCFSSTLLAQEIAFSPLELEAPATSYEMTEDGNFLIVSHEVANLVSVFDVLQNRVVKTISMESPRSILCRRGLVFIANHGAGSITILSQASDWKLIRKVNVHHPGIVHLSAPMGSRFANELLVTCHGPGMEASYQDSRVFVVEVGKDRCSEIGGHSLVTSSADGRLAINQQSFNLSPSGSIEAYKYDVLTTPGNDRKPEFRGGEIQTPFIYQVAPSGFWLSHNMVLGGIPIRKQEVDVGALIIPDLSKKVIYALNEYVLRALTLTTNFREVGNRKVRFAPFVNEPSQLFVYRERLRHYTLDHPVAYTHGDQLHLFLINPTGGMILRAQTLSFSTGAAQPSNAELPDLATAAAPPPLAPTIPIQPESKTSQPQPQPPSDTLQDVSSLPASPPTSLANAIERSELSVVRIETTSPQGSSMGSGFVVDDKGTMVTNCHVLRGATAAKAVFSDGQVTDITGTLLIDENRDIVVARLAIANRPKLIFSTALPRKGDSVVALGAPHGLAFTATRGIVSAIRDAGEMSLELDHPSIEGMWIQVDAALSPGNSGGPLINDAGQVIAMSTLASRGTAQNLNFGISAKDMHDAVGVAWGRSLVTLSDGVGRLADPASSAGQPSDPRSSEAEITDLAMQEYFDECKNSFARLARDLRSERARLAGIFAGMRRGATTIPANLDDGSDVLRTIHPRSNNITWYFRSQSIKNRELTRMESRIEEQDRVRADVKSADDPNSILTLATQYGAPLDPRRLHSVGFINDAIVVHPLSDHELAILYDEAVYLLIVPTTVGLSLGQDVGPRPVFVGGTVTVSVKNQPSSAVTVLLSIDESQLRRVMNLSSESSSTNATPNTTPRIGGSAEQPAASTVSQLNTPLSAAQSSYRVWKDLTGKFSVEAQLQSFDGTKVKLRRRDGPVIEVPVSSLSDADRQFLKTQ